MKFKQQYSYGMKIYQFILIVALIYSSKLLSQSLPQLQPNKSIEGLKEGEWVIWLTKGWNPTGIKDSAAYYRKIKYKNGVPEGKVRDYYLNGKIQWEGNLKSDNPDVIDGIAIWYYESGKKSQECKYINGKKDGKELIYFENGNIKELNNYKNDFLDGISLEYFENGNLFIRGEYKEDLKIGNWMVFSEDGELKDIVNFEPTWENLTALTQKYYDRGYYSEAEEFAERAFKQAEIEFEKTNEFYYQSLINLNVVYKKNRKNDKLIECHKKMLEYFKRKNGENSIEYRNTLNIIGKSYEENKENEKAIIYYNEEIDNIKEYLGINSDEYFARIYQLSQFYIDIKDFENALTMNLIMKDISERKNNKTNRNDCIILWNLSSIYSELRQYDKALQNSIVAIKICQNHTDYKNRIFLADLYEKNGQTENSLLEYIAILKYLDETFGKNHTDYLLTLKLIDMKCMKLGKFEKALEYSLEYNEITKNEKGENHVDYGLGLNHTATILLKIGQYEKAIQYFIKALEITGNYLGKSHEEYVTILNNLGSTYLYSGQYEKAFLYSKKAFEIAEKNEVGNPENLIMTSINLAQVYYKLGQFENAISSNNEAIIIQKKYLGKKDKLYATLLNNNALIYLDAGQYNHALHHFFEAKEIIEEISGKNNLEYIIVLDNIGRSYSSLGQYENALDFHKQAQKIAKETLGENNIDYLVILENLSDLHMKLGNFKKALLLNEEILKTSKEILSSNHPLIPEWLMKQGLCNFKLGNETESFNNFKDANSMIIGNIQKNLNNFSEKDREAYLINFNYNINFFHCFYSEYFFKNQGIYKEIFNNELLFKSMILNSVIFMKRNIEKSNDTMLIQKFEDWRQLKFQLAKQYSLPIAKRLPDLDSLEQITNDLEGELASLSSSYNQINTIQKARWEDVKKSLKTGETAIEFSHFKYHNLEYWTDSIMYIAIVLRPQDTLPILIPLCEQKQLDSIFVKSSMLESKNINDSYHNKRLYELIFKPIEPYLKKGDNVYYAPSGILNQIAFNAIMSNDSTYISDIYSLNQVSSTALLLENYETSANIEDIAVFGGINYDATEKEVENEISSLKKDEYFASRSLYFIDSTRSDKWTYLPGTLNEINEISDIAANENINVKKYTGINALEEHIKLFNGNESPSILHIATHGFFFPDPKIDLKKLEMQSFGENNRFSVADNPMNRSGLLFTGCNNAWTSDSLTFNHEDGILTAYEAGNINLTNTELAVLSACETGLGTIKGSEGVYGLQRAFKQAGAKYILMSLWKVPDKETGEFMTLFYNQYLVEKKDIRSAYYSAQSQMKNLYRTSPYKWAGFVLFE